MLREIKNLHGAVFRAYDHVNLTRTQIKNCPGIETNEPVSHQWEMETHDYDG